MFFIVITAVITLLCLWGLLRTFKERNYLAVVFSFLGLVIFGWFTIMETLQWMNVV